ncbi:hypothetical protein EYF80_056621 [Liparis tanakae]|uniref:Uncharacterized protein n=1 Tax=Liparis tanakae TaxID=230148 RepID=A0A4Z2EWR2_9TELE|nr:hypothetical protein EYF80_056621 [Liparis tanakae]
MSSLSLKSQTRSTVISSRKPPPPHRLPAPRGPGRGGLSSLVHPARRLRGPGSEPRLTGGAAASCGGPRGPEGSCPEKSRVQADRRDEAAASSSAAPRRLLLLLLQQGERFRTVKRNRNGRLPVQMWAFRIIVMNLRLP